MHRSGIETHRSITDSRGNNYGSPFCHDSVPDIETRGVSRYQSILIKMGRIKNVYGFRDHSNTVERFTTEVESLFFAFTGPRVFG